MRSVYGATTGHALRVLFIASPGDHAEREALLEAGLDFIEVDGNYAEKINAGVDATDEPLVFTGADDLKFHPGWLDAALDAMGPGIGVVGTQDLCNPKVIRGEHATHFLVRRAYVEDFGTIDERGKLFHEGYPHEFVDDELIGTAKLRDAYAFAGDSVVEHLHPLAGKAPTDALYEASAERMRRGRPIFERRRKLWQGAS